MAEQLLSRSANSMSKSRRFAKDLLFFASFASP
jgi:hypothetical protein